MLEKKKAKKTWSRKIHTTYDVGNCKYCSEHIDSDVSFIVFATKEPAHFSCYKTQTEGEQNASSR